jgi:hypothetical protein
MAWWNADKRDLLAECVGFSDDLRRRQYYTHRAQAEAALFLYRGSSSLQLSGLDDFWRGDEDDVPPHNNVIGSAVDWFTAIMVRTQVRPFYLTIKGDAKTREKAAARQRAVEGTFWNLGLYDLLGELRCRDGHIWRGGGVKFTADLENRRVAASRVRPWEVLVPEREARLGFPRQMVHGQLVDRAVLRGMFPENSDARKIIDEAEPESFDPHEQIANDHSDLLLVRELWHLPSARVDLDDEKVFGLDKHHEFDPTLDCGHDGRRVLALHNGILNGEGYGEPWPYDHFPISWYKPFHESVGFWSRGIPDIIGGIQLAILEHGDSIQRYIRRHAVPHLITWDKARINPLEMSNDDSKIWSSRVPPAQAAQYLNTNAVPGEVFQREDKLERLAKERLGVSDMNLFGEKPKGVEHAPGMEHLSEMTQIRQTTPYKAWERASIQDAKNIDGCLYTLAQYDDDMSVTFGDDKELVRIKWREMNMKHEDYSITCQPTNYFAQTPTAKFRQVKEMGQAGLFNGTPQSRVLLRALDMPDVAALSGDDSGAEDNIKRCLDAAAKGEPDESWIPTAIMDLELCKQQARDRYNRMEADGESPEAIDRVVRFFELADELSKRATPTAGPDTQLAPVEMPPPGAPMPPPPPGAV